MSFCTSCGKEFESSGLFCQSCGSKRPDGSSQKSWGASQQMTHSRKGQDTFHPDSSSTLPDETFNKEVALRVSIIPLFIVGLILLVVLPIVLLVSVEESGSDTAIAAFLIIMIAVGVTLFITFFSFFANGKSFLRKTRYLRINKNVPFSDLSHLKIKGYQLAYNSGDKIVFKPSTVYQFFGGYFYGAAVHIIIQKQGDEGIISYYGVDDASNFFSFRPALFKIVYGRFIDALAKVTEFTVLRTN